MKKLFKSSKRNRRPRKPSFILSRVSLLAATLAFAAFTVTEYGLSLWNTDSRLAIFVMLVFAISALVTPAVVPLIARARGFSRIALILVCVAFGAIDSFGLSQAFNGFEVRATQAAYDQAQHTLEEERAPISARLQQAEAKLASLSLPMHDYTSRQKAALASYEAQADVLQAAIVSARADLAALPKMAERPDLFNNAAILLIATFIQVALAIGFVAIEATRQREFAEAMFHYEAALAQTRADRQQKRMADLERERIRAANASTPAKIELVAQA